MPKLTIFDQNREESKLSQIQMILPNQNPKKKICLEIHYEHFEFSLEPNWWSEFLTNFKIEERLRPVPIKRFLNFFRNKQA